MNKDLALKIVAVVTSALLLICIIFLIVDGVKDRKVRENNYSVTIQLANKENEILTLCGNDLGFEILTIPGVTLSKICDIATCNGEGEQYTLYIPGEGLYLVGVNYEDGIIHYVDVEGQLF